MCAECHNSFNWNDAYVTQQTPGSAVFHPPGYGDTRPRVFCPHCGKLVVDWHITKERDFDEWIWFGNHGAVNRNNSLPPDPYSPGFGKSIPHEFTPNYSEHLLDIKMGKKLEQKKAENKRTHHFESTIRTTGTKEYNKISKGFLFSLWNLIPLIGIFIYVYKLVKAGIGATEAKVAVWISIGLIILANIIIGIGEPAQRYAGVLIILGGIIFLWIIAIKYIGWKFFLGSFIIPLIFLMGIASSMIVPRYIELEANAKQRAIKAAISQLNNRESQIWEDKKNSKSGWVSDAKVLNAVNYDLGKDYIWSNGHPTAGGRELSYKGTTVTFKRSESIGTEPARWSME